MSPVSINLILSHSIALFRKIIDLISLWKMNFLTFLINLSLVLSSPGMEYPIYFVTFFYIITAQI